MGIDLRTGRPTAKAVKEAVKTLLGNPKYKWRAEEVRAEMLSYDPVEITIQTIQSLAAGPPHQYD